MTELILKPRIRCPLPKKTSDSCVEIPDPADPCCKQVLCDVTLDDHQDQEKEPEMLKPNKHKIVSATQPNSSLILLDIDPKYEEDDDNLPIVEVSNDKENWNYYQLFPKGELFVKENFKFVRLEATEDIVEVGKPSNNTDMKSNKMEEVESKQSEGECKYKGRSFKFGEEYNDGCESLCACHQGEMRCLKLECPTYFGVDVLGKLILLKNNQTQHQIQIQAVLNGRPYRPTLKHHRPIAVRKRFSAKTTVPVYIRVNCTKTGNSYP